VLINIKMKYIQNINKVIRIIFGIFFLSLSLLAIIAPTYQSICGYPKGEKIYSLLSPICHQYPTRSIWIFDRPFALCSRCFGGYLGLGISYFIIHPKQKYLFRLLKGIILVIPGITDGIFQLMTIYESSNIIRLITGILGGIGIFYILYPFKSVKDKKEDLNENIT